MPNSRQKELKSLILPFLERLNKVALYLCRDKDDAEDLVAETLLKACENFGKLNDISKFKPWVLRIMNNTFISDLRERNKMKTEFIDFDTAGINVKTLNAWGPNPEQFLINRLLDKDIRQKISELPEEFRMTVVLCDIENLSYAEISKITAVPVGTVRSRLSRGRSILQKKLHHLALEMGIVKKKKIKKEEACTCN